MCVVLGFVGSTKLIAASASCRFLYTSSNYLFFGHFDVIVGILVPSRGVYKELKLYTYDVLICTAKH